MASDINVIVRVVTDRVANVITCSSDITAEDLCILLCKQYKISPLTRTLFSLRITGTDYFLNDNRKVVSLKKRDFELRIRYKVPCIAQLIELDEITYDYYFQQVRNDVRDGNVPEIKYSEHKDHLLGLGITDMYRAMLEDKLSQSLVEKNYKKYIPKIIVKNHGHFAKQNAQKLIPQLLANKDAHKINFVKGRYLQQLNTMAPNYLAEDYRDVSWRNNGSAASTVHLQIVPFHDQEPGLRMYNTLNGEWSQISTIEDLVCMTRGGGNTLEVGRKSGMPLIFQFKSDEQLSSFLSACDAYYRLMVKWTYNLSNDDKTPSLQYLYRMRCHGPVGGAFSYRKLQEKSNNANGAYILRQCKDEYDVYYLDVCKNSKPNTYRLEYEQNNFIFNEKKYSTLAKLISDHQNRDEDIYLEYCIPPSEYDKSQLLLCSEKQKKGERINQNQLQEILKDNLSPRCLRPNDIFLYPDIEKVGTAGITITSKGLWRLDDTKKLDIAFKTLQKKKMNEHLKGFIELASKWMCLQESTIVKLHGITLSSPTAMVLEYIPYGPLDDYLRKNRSRVGAHQLTSAATSLASALWHMSEARIVHGYLRAGRLLVAHHDADRLAVKLSCPSLRPYRNTDIPWIPVELLSDMKLAKLSDEGDIWAFGTTLWEIFSYGKSPLDIKNVSQKESWPRLSAPARCPAAVWELVTSCWERDPHRRPRAQEIMRNMTRIMHDHDHDHDHRDHRDHRDRTVSSASLASDNTDYEPINENPGFSNTSDTSSLIPLISHSGLMTDSEDDISSSSRMNSIRPNLSMLMNISQPERGVVESEPNVMNWFISHGQTEYFTFVKEIGRGHYGVVYQGYAENDRNERKAVAVKTFKRHQGSNSKDYTNELEIMNSLYHHNIVEVLGWWQHDAEVGIVMEYLELGPLKNYLKFEGHKLTIWHHIKYARDIATGMDYVSAKGIVHRDLAARNILVKDQKTVKIADFGLSRVLEKSEDAYKLRSDRFLLPMGWYAPEAVKVPYKFSTKSDVWSYGVTVWEIFSGKDVPDHDKQPADRASCFVQPETCPSEVYQLLMRKCWEIEPQNRPTFIDLVQICIKLLKPIRTPDDG